MDQRTEPAEPPHSHRLRTGRVTLRAAIYLLTTVTSARRRLFEVPELAEIVAGALRHYHDRGWVHGFAWVVMPDHVHWLCQLRVGTVSNLMRMFKIWTSTQVKKRLADPPVRIWQPGFHDRMVRINDRLEDYIDYLVANPLRWGLVRQPEDYPYLYADAEVLDVFGTGREVRRPW